MQKMERYLKKMILLAMMLKIRATIDGKSYMDPLDAQRLNKKLPGEDPCNPLYWYPRHVPEYCYFKPTVKPSIKPPLPVPLPVPIPVPPPAPIPIPIPSPSIPIPIPFPPPIAIPLPAPLPVPPPIPPLPVPYPIYPIPSLIQNPYIPSMYPLPNFPFGYPPQAGMVPGLPGMVSRDGGINILPFSDAYSDMLEKHKNRMMRRKLARILHEYEDFPNRKSYRRLKKFRKMY